MNSLFLTKEQSDYLRNELEYSMDDAKCCLKKSGEDWKVVPNDEQAGPDSVPTYCLEELLYKFPHWIRDPKTLTFYQFNICRTAIWYDEYPGKTFLDYSFDPEKSTMDNVYDAFSQMIYEGWIENDE